MNIRNDPNSTDLEQSGRSDGILRYVGGGDDDHTAVTVSADLDEAGASLPLPEEVRTSMGGGSTRRLGRNGSNSPVSLKWVYLGAALSLIVLVIVVPIVSFRPAATKNNSLSEFAGGGIGENNGYNSYTIPRGPDPEAARRPRPLLQNVVQFLIDNSVSTPEDLHLDGSPQNLAAAWLAEEDPANLVVPLQPAFNTTTLDGYRYMMRYVMALNFYAMDGENWFDDMNFLSGDDVCFWHTLIAEGGFMGCMCAAFDYPVPRWVKLSKFLSITI